MDDEGSVSTKGIAGSWTKLATLFRIAGEIRENRERRTDNVFNDGEPTKATATMNAHSRGVSLLYATGIHLALAHA